MKLGLTVSLPRAKPTLPGCSARCIPITAQRAVPVHPLQCVLFCDRRLRKSLTAPGPGGSAQRSQSSCCTRRRCWILRTAGIPAIGWQYPRHFGGSDHIFFARMGENIIFRKKVCTNLKVFDTICRATIERQSEAKQLAQSADAIVVVGGLHSANTTALAALCGSYCPHSAGRNGGPAGTPPGGLRAPALSVLLPALQPRLVSLRRFKIP